MSAKEIEVLRKRDWTGDPQLGNGHDPVTVIDGKSYLTHKPNHECIYLDAETSLCRVELRFGHEAKPLGCRLFPFHPVAVSPKVISCTARFDCPSIQQNHGPLLSEQRVQIARFAREMNLMGQTEQVDPEGLKPESVVMLAEAFARLFNDRDPRVASLALLLVAQHFDGLGADFLNDRATMDEILPPLLTKFTQLAEEALTQAKPPGAMDRVLFRLWLANYLRRDEELINQSFARRIGRMQNLTAIVLGFSDLEKLGAEHPKVKLRSVELFAAGNTVASPEAWDCWQRFVQGRLHTLQFFGSALNGETFFIGAQKLAAIFSLVSTTAKISAAAANHADRLEAADVEYAVGAIDHSFGRSPILLLAAHQLIEKYFISPARLARVMR